MKATDIKNKTFNKKVSGYDKKQVDAYMMDVARVLDNLETDNQRLQQELYDRNAELDEFHGKAETLNRSIVVAQEAADKLRENALDEVELIIKKAETEAENILKEAAQRATKVNEEMTHLQEASRMYLHQSIGMALQAKEMFENPRWLETFDKNPVLEVSTPELDQVLADLKLPVRNNEGQTILANEEKIVEKEKEKEAFFNNDKPAVLPEEVQNILAEEGKKVAEEKQAATHTTNDSEVATKKEVTIEPNKQTDEKGDTSMQETSDK